MNISAWFRPLNKWQLGLVRQMRRHHYFQIEPLPAQLSIGDFFLGLESCENHGSTFPVACLATDPNIHAPYTVIV
jgi:hypothetical protein